MKHIFRTTLSSPSGLRLRALFPMAFFCCLVHAQTTVQWSTPQVITTTTQTITAPRVQLLDDGTPVVVWGESATTSRIWCSRWENGLFTPPVSVVTNTPAPALFGFGGFDMAVHGQKAYVVFERLSSGIFLARSDNGGMSFSTPVKVQGITPGNYPTLAGVTTDETGNVFVTYIFESSSSTHQLRFSSDGGATFSAATEASAPADGTKVCECCPAALLAAGDSVWLAFRNNNNNIRDHWVSRSTNLAASFDIATDIDSTDWLINACPISGPAMARSGDSLLIAWKTGAGGGSRVFVSSLHSGSMQAGQQLRIGQEGALDQLQNQPEIVALGDTVGIVYQESNESIIFTHSTMVLSWLDDHYQRFEEPGATLTYPALAFRNQTFHLVYANTSSGELIYQQGTLVPTVGVKAPDMNTSVVHVFPNPSTSHMVEIGSDTDDLQECSFFDVLGKYHGSRQLSGRRQSMDISELPPGVYWLRIKTSRGEAVRRLIIGY